MNQKVQWITRTAAMLATLICLQWLGSYIPEPTVKQLITGTCVNAVLAVTAMRVGMSGGITVALISPVCAFLFGIAPNFITVLPIMAANVCFVALLKLLAKDCAAPVWRQAPALLTAAGIKFLVLYLLVVQLICGIAAPSLLGKRLGGIVLLAPRMLTLLPAMFTWPQLITALAGGAIALLITPILQKATRK